MRQFLILPVMLVWSIPAQAAYKETMNPDAPSKNAIADFGMIDDQAKSNQSETLQNAIDELANKGGGWKIRDPLDGQATSL